jgi:hypothetical protein
MMEDYKFMACNGYGNSAMGGKDIFDFDAILFVIRTCDRL